jgi:sugar-specific transcriptional regulator TrmB
LTKEDTKYIEDFNEKVKFTSSFGEFTSSIEEPTLGSIVPTNPNNLQGAFSWSRSMEVFPKPKRRGRPTGSKNKVKNNSIESINEFEDMTIVKGSFNEVYSYSDTALAEQVRLEEVVTGSFQDFSQEEIESDVIEEVESDVVEDITFEAIDEDYDISSGEPEEEIIVIPSINKPKSRNYREPKSDVKKNFLNRS